MFFCNKLENSGYEYDPVGKQNLLGGRLRGEREIGVKWEFHRGGVMMEVGAETVFGRDSDRTNRDAGPGNFVF